MTVNILVKNCQFLTRQTWWLDPGKLRPKLQLKSTPEDTTIYEREEIGPREFSKHVNKDKQTERYTTPTDKANLQQVSSQPTENC